MSYKDEIMLKIKDAVNSWIDKLKVEYPKLSLVKQWKIDYRDGFVPGHTILPVITGSKKGPYLISEVEFIVPESLELDLENIEITLKNEPYKKSDKKIKVMAVDEPFSQINEMIMGMNSFLSSVDFGRITPQHPTSIPHSIGLAGSNDLKIKSGPAFSRQGGDDIDGVHREVKSSKHLPEWIKNISSSKVYDSLTRKIAEGFTQYRKKGNTSTLQEFFKLYEDYLKSEGKLNDWCRYRDKSIKLNEKSWCQEEFCSKKPWQKKCEYSTLKFGSKDE